VTLAADPGFPRLAEVAERCANITAKAGEEPGPTDTALFTEPAERDLAAAFERAAAALPAGDALLAAEDALRLAAALRDPLDRFFREVFVNAEDVAVRRNRLRLLGGISATLARLGDLGKAARSTR
jgi:glycyl-tRNA synthetase beta chain